MVLITLSGSIALSQQETKMALDWTHSEATLKQHYKASSGLESSRLKALEEEVDQKPPGHEPLTWSRKDATSPVQKQKEQQ
jgi:hypothetical protein